MDTEPGKGIKFWAEDDRPREKMLQKGSHTLSDAELISLLLQKGTHKKSAVDLARDLLYQAQNRLDLLSRFSLKEMQKVKGVGEAKACTLMAALEIGRRRRLAEAMNQDKLASSKAVADFLIPLLQDKITESFYVLYLNQGSKLIHWEELHTGGISCVFVDVRVLIRNALFHMAAKIVVAHNHPGGSLRPSRDDVKITEKIKNAAELLEIQLLDHIIVAGTGYYSFAEDGRL